ncbi:MAG: hypothetical protein E6Q88_02800 [Lysobacteraceae bacterium]|nr:MAG: hypothetical protein E6Q88_02800 [Xanthomonadaceae bacterium]
MKKPLAAALLLACIPFAASARDSLGSYSYVQADVYRLNVDRENLSADSLDFDGVQIRGSIEMSDNLYAYGGIGWSRNGDLPVDIDAREMQVGVGYRHGIFDNVDLIAELGFQHTKLDAETVVDNLDAAKLSVGVRGALSNSVEGWLKASHLNGSDYESEFAGSLGVQFVVNETWGIVGEFESGDLTSRYSVGIRASF